jgi:TfoX/Sxy family transcriptional regulator of competence genes
MAWVKIPKEHHPIFEAALPRDDRIETRVMFGGLAAMVNGQMMGGLWGTSAVVKLSPADYAAVEEKGGVPFDPMGNGRTMEGSIVLPESEFSDRSRLAAWLAKSFAYVVTLPPKKKAAPAKKAAAPVAKKAAAPRKKAAASPKKR